MNDDLNHLPMRGDPSDAARSPRRLMDHAASSRGWPHAVRWLPRLVAALLWLTLVYGLPLQTLRESRRIAKDELAHLLQTDRPDTPAILDAFDRATEQVLFSVAAPYFILGLATVFITAHLAATKRRLYAAERNIQTLRDVVLGVDGISLR